MSQKNIRKIRTGLNIIVPAIIPVLFICIWQMLSDAECINTRLFPAPSSIWDTFMDLIDKGILQENLIVSARRILIGFLIGGTAGLIVGILTGLFSWVNSALSAIVGALRPIPMVAWIPLFILWFGIDETPKIAVITVGSFWPILVNTSQGIKNVDVKYLEVGRILEKKQIDMLLKIVWPASLPSVFTGLRLGISSAWNCVVTAEMIAASAGIGHMINQSRQYNNVSQVLVGVAIIGVFGLVIDEFLIWLESKVLSWNYQDKR